MFSLAVFWISQWSYFGIFMLAVHAECGFRLMTDATVFLLFGGIWILQWVHTSLAVYIGFSFCLWCVLVLSCGQIMPLLWYMVFDGSNLEEWYDNSILLSIQKHMWLLFCFFFSEDWAVYILDPFFGFWNSPRCEYTECNFDLERWIKITLFFLWKK